MFAFFFVEVAAVVEDVVEVEVAESASDSAASVFPLLAFFWVAIQ